MGVAKEILEKYGSHILIKSPQSIIWHGERQAPNANMSTFYRSDIYSRDICLWKAPANWIRIEFDGLSANDNKDYVAETLSNLAALDIECFVTMHSDTSSPYINIPNIRGMPINEDNKAAKMLLLNEILSERAMKNLDKTNLGYTWTPVIGHPHWKDKHGGREHAIVRGKPPMEIENEYPKELLRKLRSNKKKNLQSVKKLSDGAKWVEDFLLNYCCSNKLPSGNRHAVINKNLGIMLAFNKDAHQYITQYQQNNPGAGYINSWMRRAVDGTYTEVNPFELKKYINDNDIPYKIIEETNVVDEEALADTINFFSDKRNLANQFMDIQPFFYDRTKSFWLWNNKELFWEMVDEIDILNAISKVSRADTIKGKEKYEILEALKQVGRLKIPEELPSGTLQIGREIINIYTGERFDSTPRFFSTNKIPHQLGESEDTPVIDKMFNDWQGADNTKTLQQICAYCMLPDYPIHRIFCLVGDGSNGKSTFIRFIHNLVGHENACSVSMDGIMTNRFETWGMYRKLVAEMGETNYSTLKRTDMLKKLSGQDNVSFEKKGKDSISTTNYAKLIISTNSVPETSDKTDGFYRRWWTIIFKNKFKDGRDVLTEIPDEEYGNFCLKSIRLLRDLLESRQFCNEPTLEEKRSIYDNESNPFKYFFEENCIQGVQDFIPKFRFKERFDSWCKQNKFRVFSDTEVSLKMKEYNIDAQRKQVDEVDANGFPKRWNSWIDIGWKESHSERQLNGNEKITKLRDLINVSPEKNSIILETMFGEEYIANLKEQGILYEPIRGEYKLLVE